MFKKNDKYKNKTFRGICVYFVRAGMGKFRFFKINLKFKMSLNPLLIVVFTLVANNTNFWTEETYQKWVDTKKTFLGSS